MLIVDQLKRGDPKLRWLALGVLVGMFVLITGLWFLQVVNYKKYERNLIEQSYRTVRLPAVRGRILDRNGVILAESRPSYNVNLYLEELRPAFQQQYRLLKSNAVHRIELENKSLPADKKKKTRLTFAQTEELGRQARFMVANNLVRRISESLAIPVQLTEKQFRKHYEEKLSLPMPIVENLSSTNVARFAESLSTLPGVDLQVQSLRSYPSNQLGAHILGYMTRTEKAPNEEEGIEFDYRLPDFKGAVGIEGAFDEQLRGVAGAKSLLVNNMQYRQAENVWLSPKPGDDVILTIDAQIQKTAESSLGMSSRGAIVVMDVRNGDVLAMASAPTFDPNSFVPTITHAEYAKINDVETKPMLNRASFAIYQPGSSFKIVVALAALEAGKLNPHEQFYSKGFYPLSSRYNDRMDCTAGAGYFDFHRAFIKSCNCYFADHGLNTGLDNILRMGHQFCLGQKTGLPTRQDVAGYFPAVGTRKRNMGGAWTFGDTANLSIGQGDIAVTPLQMTVMTAAIANGGKVFWPRLVDRLESDDNGFRKVTESFPAGRVRNELIVKPQNLRLVQEAMRDDVADSEGTGKGAAMSGWQVCGKTGTATVKLGRSMETSRFTWFVSYAPFDSPRYAVVAMVEGGASGGGTCAPMARRVFEALQKMEQNSRVAGPNLVLGN
ncbi:MAG: ftsI [Verrucomicrobia bacterium]|jgi:penicillin-binding protein 2|nr:ftsI [Verrucomicrobiota bacterium]